MRSMREEMTPSSVPNCESAPSVNSIRKNKTAQSGGNGNWLIASVNIMKARPVPAADCVERGRERERRVFNNGLKERRKT